ncbi:hypothetical protein, partial [Glaesserella parasuis]|uniref:hypothetical protein n=1 Tax=Glaesserella parasuis TaxID=738 RepID=UPI003F337F8A
AQASQIIKQTYTAPTPQPKMPERMVFESNVDLDGEQLGRGVAEFVKDENDKKEWIYRKVKGEG